jgi:hypothetical protein
MKRLLFIGIAMITMASCKKEHISPRLSQMKYKIINNGDSLAVSFVLWTTTIYGHGTMLRVHDQAFNNVKPFDTLTMTTASWPGKEDNFIGAVRNFKLRVGLSKKIFSQMHYDSNYLEGGDPYQYGWTQTLNFLQETKDTLNTPNDTVIYIKWPQDSAKLKQVIFF